MYADLSWAFIAVLLKWCRDAVFLPPKNLCRRPFSPSVYAWLAAIKGFPFYIASFGSFLVGPS
jgi:hypothetical protein